MPALCVSFLDSSLLTNMDLYLNILQSVQLPFALIPLIKFVGSKKIMGDFALSKYHIWFASGFGTFMFFSNFIQIFGTLELTQFYVFVPVMFLTIVYLSLIITAIQEPLSPLKKITKEELEDHEYDKIIIEGGDTLSETVTSEASDKAAK